MGRRRMFGHLGLWFISCFMGKHHIRRVGRRISWGRIWVFRWVEIGWRVSCRMMWRRWFWDAWRWINLKESVYSNWPIPLTSGSYCRRIATKCSHSCRAILEYMVQPLSWELDLHLIMELKAKCWSPSKTQ